MFQSIVDFYEKYIKHHLFRNEDEDDNAIDDDNPQIKQMRILGALLQKTNLPLNNRLQAALSIGILSFTGGPEATASAQNYIEELIRFLNRTLLLDKDKIIVLQSLSGICYNNVTNQNAAIDLQILITLVTILNTRNTTKMKIMLKYWACYLLNILCCNNIAVARRLNKTKHLHTSLIQLSESNWYGWPKNYAQVLIYLLGFEKQIKSL
ncbi:armadillo-like helical domain-containing protein 2 [Chiloscyllium plagiosum]|uniref:armadillo-like helical domain-containing protein 2 n=1 Tax=Chiloscyllium plagiosum TaxID=36176 RepID=UPI001CB7F41F|nr:armadillo-like helical domain-containing protein 2 [Chiloscyllium plagiosum]